jgi:hypothetical protein
MYKDMATFLKFWSKYGYWESHKAHEFSSLKKHLYITFWLNIARKEMPAYISILKVLFLSALRCPPGNDCCVNGLCACDLREVRRTSVSRAGKKDRWNWRRRRETELKSREKLIRMGGSDDRRYRDGSEGGTAEGWRWRRNNSGPKMYFK